MLRYIFLIVKCCLKHLTIKVKRCDDNKLKVLKELQNNVIKPVIKTGCRNSHLQQ